MLSEFVSLENIPKSTKTYRSILHQLMSLKDGVNYEKCDVFHDNELRQLTPTEIWTKRSLGQPSSHKDKNSLDDQLITGKPFSIEKVEDEKKKKKKKFRSMKLSQR